MQKLANTVKKIDSYHKTKRPCKVSVRFSCDNVNRCALQAWRINTAKRSKHNDQKHCDHNKFFVSKIRQNAHKRLPDMLGVLHLGKSCVSIHHAGNIAFFKLRFTHGSPPPLPFENHKYRGRFGRSTSVHHAYPPHRSHRFPAPRSYLHGEPMRYAVLR